MNHVNDSALYLLNSQWSITKYTRYFILQEQNMEAGGESYSGFTHARIFM